MLPAAVLWVDPGKMTGVAFYQTKPWTENWDYQALPYFAADEKPFGPACRDIESMCAAWTGRLAFGWERFDINSETHKKTRGGTTDAMHIIGVCRYLAARYGCQQLPEAAQHTPDKLEQEQLKKLGWWVPGKDDAQSAAAHMLRWLVRSNELTPAQRSTLYGV
jgi:hypothetical protein